MTSSWTSTIDKVTEDFNSTFGALDGKDLNWKPDSRSWSIAQNIDHLMVINQTYFPVIAALRNGTYQVPWPGKIKFLTDFMGKAVLKAVQPDRRKKMKTFSLWQPSASDLPADLLHRFEEHQTALKSIIDGSRDLLDRNTVIASPASKNVVYTLATAFDIIVAHEQRHLEQAKEVYRLLQEKSPASPVVPPS